MLHCDLGSGLGDVEHVENDGLVASVLAVVYGADHLDYRLSRLDRRLLAVEPDDREFALLDDSDPAR